MGEARSFWEDEGEMKAVHGCPSIKSFMGTEPPGLSQTSSLSPKMNTDDFIYEKSLFCSIILGVPGRG